MSNRVGNGPGRFQYLQALVTEFQKTQRKEYKLQVLANLANFAYDPANFDFFRQLNILDLFLDVIAEEHDNKMIEFAVGGICNCCIDELNQAFLQKSDCLDLLIQCLKSLNEETVLSAMTALLYLITPSTKNAIVDQTVYSVVKKISCSSNRRLGNLAKLLLQI